uniref:NADH-ubiquinone oxidoreductase chain 5 n=1 Tax=Parasagitta elegans TaxID=1562708 RepID=A0A141CLB9_9BILA|nr:NADH dehydrogenase subunit 5 [Parasagitta elegans]
MVIVYICLSLLSVLLLYNIHYSLMFSQLGVLSMNMVFDSYSCLFLLLLSLISSCVLVWSYYYMDLDVSYRRFLSLVFAFLGSMFILVFFGSMYGALIGWDGLGVTSFLLVIYYKNRKALGSGMLTALTNRLGDCFFLVLLAVQFSQMLNTYVLTVLLLLTSMTKSAQFPFSSWLPAAMAAPTPVSALVHSSTLVTAGIYLLIRFNSMGTEWLLVVGSVTMLMAGLCACAEMDLKKIVALSTLSQLGVMMVALSVKLKGLCFFHLTTHAMFKALLFMCVGIGIHTVYGSQDFRIFSAFSGVSMLPTLCLSIANMSLAGFPFMSGFYSKDAILESFYNSGESYLFQVIFLLGVGLTTAYSVKMTHLAFLCIDTGGAADLPGGGTQWVNKIPLTALCFCSVGGGSVLSRPLLETSTVEISLDKLMPLIWIFLGVLGGMAVTKAKASVLSTMWYLSPFVQRKSMTGVSMGQATDLDRGLYILVSAGGFEQLLKMSFSSCRWALLVGMLSLSVMVS